MNKYILYLIVCFLPFSWACEDIIELDVPEGEVKLVVDGLITDQDSVHYVNLSQTSPYFSNTQTPRVSGATVFLTDSKGRSYNFTETAFGTGEYRLNMKAEDSVDYILNIITPNGRKYATFPERLNRVPPIDSLYQSEEYIEEIPDFREGGYYMNLATREIEGQGDYYKWDLFLNGEKVISPFTLYVVDDRLYDGNPIVDWDMLYGLQPGDVVEVHQLSISKRAYNFWYLMALQLQNFGSPFDTPPAQIKGNVYNVSDPDEVVLGYFGVSRISRASLTIIQR